MTNILHSAWSGKPIRGTLAAITNDMYHVIVWMRVVQKTVMLSKNQLPTTVVFRATFTQMITLF